MALTLASVQALVLALALRVGALGLRVEALGLRVEALVFALASRFWP